MVANIIPWSPYEGRGSIAAKGRTSLTAAFEDLIESRTGYPPHDLAEVFAAPEDEADDDATRDLLRLHADLLAQVFCNGRINTFARPLGGEEIVLIPAD